MSSEPNPSTDINSVNNVPEQKSSTETESTQPVQECERTIMMTIEEMNEALRELGNSMYFG